MKELSREQALLKLEGMLDILDCIHTVITMSDEESLTEEDILCCIEDMIDELNDSFEPPLMDKQHDD